MYIMGTHFYFNQNAIKQLSFLFNIPNVAIFSLRKSLACTVEPRNNSC